MEPVVVGPQETGPVELTDAQPPQVADVGSGSIAGMGHIGDAEDRITSTTLSSTGLAPDPMQFASNPDMQLALLYQAALGRLPDNPGLAFWKGDLTQGTESIQSIAQHFVDSSEFATRFGTPDNEGFVNQMYENVLGRAPDVSGSAFWENSLQAGATRGSVLIGFGESQENLQLHGPGIIDSGFLDV